MSLGRLGTKLKSWSRPQSCVSVYVTMTRCTSHSWLTLGAGHSCSCWAHCPWLYTLQQNSAAPMSLIRSSTGYIHKHNTKRTALHTGGRVPVTAATQVAESELADWTPLHPEQPGLLARPPSTRRCPPPRCLPARRAPRAAWRRACPAASRRAAGPSPRIPGTRERRARASRRISERRGPSLPSSRRAAGPWQCCRLCRAARRPCCSWREAGRRAAGSGPQRLPSTPPRSLSTEESRCQRQTEDYVINVRKRRRSRPSRWRRSGTPWPRQSTLVARSCRRRRARRSSARRSRRHRRAGRRC